MKFVHVINAIITKLTRASKLTQNIAKHIRYYRPFGVGWKYLLALDTKNEDI